MDFLCSVQDSCGIQAICKLSQAWAQPCSLPRSSSGSELWARGKERGSSFALAALRADGQMTLQARSCLVCLDLTVDPSSRGLALCLDLTPKDGLFFLEPNTKCHVRVVVCSNIFINFLKEKIFYLKNTNLFNTFAFKTFLPSPLPLPFLLPVLPALFLP